LAPGVYRNRKNAKRLNTAGQTVRHAAPPAQKGFQGHANARPDQFMTKKPRAQEQLPEKKRAIPLKKAGHRPSKYPAETKPCQLRIYLGADGDHVVWS
jgi:hypothetical protein